MRILGEIHPEFVPLLQRADDIFIQTLRQSKATTADAAAGLCESAQVGRSWYDLTSQAFAVFLPVKSVGVMGDGRTYDNVCALRAVTSTDGMTADIYPFDAHFLSSVATRIINEVRGINRVVYDYTRKPPGTIEWE